MSEAKSPIESCVWRGAPLFRKPEITHQEFSEAWLRHGQLVTPWFLSAGVEEYIQIHLPDSTASEAIPGSSALAGFDGVALVKVRLGALGGNRYHAEVVLPDERRFLHEESGSNPVKRDPPARVMPEQGMEELAKMARELGGVERIVIAGGKAVVDVTDEFADQWAKCAAA